MEAFLMRLEEVLDEVEAGRGPQSQAPPDRPPRELPAPRPPLPGGPPSGPNPLGPPPELRERHEHLDVRVREVVRKLREPGPPGGAPQEREPLLAELGRLLNEQFDLRTELRRTELSQLGREIDRLRARLEQVERELLQRERERGAIIERRIKRLLGEDEGGW